MTPTRIPPTAATPEPRPPCGGTWLRDADGGLTPGDADTAQAAGLAWSPPAADARTADTPTDQPAAE